MLTIRYVYVYSSTYSNNNNRVYPKSRFSVPDGYQPCHDCDRGRRELLVRELLLLSFEWQTDASAHIGTAVYKFTMKDTSFFSHIFYKK